MRFLVLDIRQALRQVRAKPGLAAMVVLTLGLGIGAASAVFSLVYGILIRPYPYREPDRLVRIETLMAETTGEVRGGSIPDIEDWREQSRRIEQFGAHATYPNTLEIEGRAHAVTLTFISASTFPMLGVEPVLGRTFTTEEDLLNGDVHKAVLSHRLWRNLFGGDPDVLGRVIDARGDRYTVIGVMPPGFLFPDKTDLWLPSWAHAMAYGEGFWRDRGLRYREVLGRLAPGVSIREADSEMQTIADALGAEYPDTNRGLRIRITPLREAETGDIRPYLKLAAAAALMLLLIGCVNAANLLLARAASREKEIAVRASLGAGRWPILRQLLVESTMLSVAAGLAGLAVAWAGVKALPILAPVELPFWMEIAVDPVVAAFCLLLALVTGIVFGLSPALQLARVNLNDTLKEGSRGTSGASEGARRLRSFLVVAEVALSLVLLAGAGLMLRSLAKMQNVDMGVGTDQLVTAYMARFLPNATIAEQAQGYGGSFQRAVERLTQLPGVVSAGAGTDLPFSTWLRRAVERSDAEFTIRGQDARESVRNAPAQFNFVTPGFFETLGVRVVEGRTFTEADDLSQPYRVVINQHMAETLWPGQAPLGQQIRMGPSASSVWATVIGVVQNIKYHPLELQPGFDIYSSYRQRPMPQMQAIVRVQGDPERMVERIRAAIAEADPQIAIVQAKSLDQLAAEVLWQQRLWGVLLGLFAVVALALAVTGLYGVMSYLVTLRTREIGIRMALGSSRLAVLRLILEHGAGLVGVGMAIGVLGALALGRLMRTLLFGVAGSDTATLAGAAVLLAATALAACAVPALRAARIDPLVALQHD